METPPKKPSRHRKGDSDPLADLPDNVVQINDIKVPEADSESLLARIILGPLTMISFLLSLGVVDRQHRAWLVAQRQHDSGPTWWTMLSPWVLWNAQPYQSQDSTWQHATEATSSSQGTDNPADGTKYFIRKKHRKMAKLALTDALEMKGAMTLTIVVTALLGLVVVAWLVRHLHVSIV